MFAGVLPHNGNFYPRSPCGERPNSRAERQERHISIHALLAESDRMVKRCQALDISISIHALLAESDNIRSVRKGTASNFYPRSPCGERRPPLGSLSATPKFLSTLSLRRATLSLLYFSSSSTFLSTLSLRRATRERSTTLTQLPNFYPRSPCGERQRTARLQERLSHFYPRSPCGERLFSSTPNALNLVFLSTLSLRRATFYIAIMIF